MSPLQLNILLHYYAMGDDFEGKENKPQLEWIDHLVAEEILSEELLDKPVYKMTPRGIAYVEGILKVADSLPMPVWAIPTENQD